MMVSEWVLTILIGALMGCIGQGVRAVVGLKKAQDQAAGNQLTLPNVFAPSLFLVSLFIGAVAGALAGILIIKPGTAVPVETLFGLAGAGYSGADFIEGVLSRLVPVGPVLSVTTQGAGAAPPSPPAFQVPAPLPAPGPVTPFAQSAAPVKSLPS